jgi:CheY-like chemotaxis protein
MVFRAALLYKKSGPALAAARRVQNPSISAVIDASIADVLIVDDDAEGRERLLERIQQLGFVAVAAPDGVEGLRLARERSPRLILLDLEMPVMNGWQFLERRRVDPAIARIPVVVLTIGDAPVAPREDVQGQLEKPIVEHQLLLALQAFLPPAEAARPTAGAAPAFATILLVEDDDDTQASLAELLEEQGYRVLRASNGRGAEALLQSQARPDCIVLDLWMPVMDGWSFAARLQRLEGFAIPIVVITAAGPHWGYPVPVAQVMRKPLEARAFLDLIQKTLATTAAGLRSSSPA